MVVLFSGVRWIAALRTDMDLVCQAKVITTEAWEAWRKYLYSKRSSILFDQILTLLSSSLLPYWSDRLRPLSSYSKPYRSATRCETRSSRSGYPARTRTGTPHRPRYSSPRLHRLHALARSRTAGRAQCQDTTTNMGESRAYRRGKC